MKRSISLFGWKFGPESAQGDAKDSNAMATSLKDQAVYYSAKFLMRNGDVICDRGYTCRTLMEAVLGPQSVEKVRRHEAFRSRVD